MGESDRPPEPPSPDLDRELQFVQERLEERFPSVTSDAVAEVIGEAASATDGAKIQTFRPLLIEHRARDIIRLRLSA
jgi:hypothetical protein